MQIKTIKQIENLEGKRVLVRCDFNVPIKEGKVKDNFKITKSLSTIEYLIKKGAIVILTSHLGRPDGEVKLEFSLEPVKIELEKLLDKEIKLFGLDQLFELAQTNLEAGQVVLLENVRFSPDEKKNTGSFAKDLARVADIFVLEGFAVAHRPAGSVVGVAKFLPSYAGLLVEKEIEGLSKVTNPQKPFCVVLGGAKTETKIPVLKNLLTKADAILLGGGIVNTYLAAKGYEVGKSLLDENLQTEILEYVKHDNIIMPVDVVIGTIDGQNHEVLEVNENLKVKSDWAIFDIGPKTIELYAKYIKQAQTLVWNGAMGYFEQHPYETGTHLIAQLLADRSSEGAFTVCGGGETVEVLKKLNIMDKIDLVSTGGGSMLEFLSGKTLPGVEIVTLD